MSDSAAIDAALVTTLRADAALTAVMPDGVFVDEANAGATRFVIVSLIVAHDAPMFGARAFEDALYLVKAVAFSRVATAAADVRAAAARIDALLEQGTLTIPSYALMTMQRVERLRRTEVDDRDATLRWYHAGGHYQVMAAAS